VELGEGGKEKRMIELNDIITHNVCEGGGYKDVY
jgi:hypothetical protein